tara:strand:+ start:498 stop:917 length:420 start_codon:yes stop_codon:yes gene_type:complete
MLEKNKIIKNLNKLLFSNTNIKFIIFSGVLTFINLIIFQLLNNFFTNIYFFIFIYYVIAIFLKFITYKTIVFGEKLHQAFTKKALKYSILYLFCYFVNVEFLKLVKDYNDIPLVIFQLIFVFFVGIFSYFVIKKTIFKY